MDKSILFFHDDCEAGTMWANLLRQKNLRVAAVELRENAPEQLPDQAFDLIVVNVCLSRAQGVRACCKLRSTFTNPILLVAPWRDEDYVLEAYEAGIDEYIPTSIDPRVFLAKVNAWLHHAWMVSTAALDNVQVSKIRLDTERREVVIPHRPSQKLTNLEFRVLHLLMTHTDKTLDASHIIDRVWGYANSEENVLLKNVIYRLRRKIEQDPAQPVYIVTVPGMGYAFHSG